MAFNLYCEACRRAFDPRERPFDPTVPVAAPPAPVDEPPGRVVRDWAAAVAVLSELLEKPADRDLFRRHYARGETVADIAAAMGLKRMAVYQRLKRLRGLLRAHEQEFWTLLERTPPAPPAAE